MTSEELVSSQQKVSQRYHAFWWLLGAYTVVVSARRVEEKDFVAMLRVSRLGS